MKETPGGHFGPFETLHGRLHRHLWALGQRPFVSLPLVVGHINAEPKSLDTKVLLASEGIQCGHSKSFPLHTHGGPLSLGPVLLERHSPLFQGPGQAAAPSADDDVRSQMEMCSVYLDRCGETARAVTIPSSPHPPEAACITSAVETTEGLGPAG